MSLTGGYPRFSNASDDAKSVEARPAWYPAIIQKGSTIYSARYCQTSSFMTIIIWNYMHLKMISWNPLSNNIIVIIRACIFRYFQNSLSSQVIPSLCNSVNIQEHICFIAHQTFNGRSEHWQLLGVEAHRARPVPSGNPVAMWRCRVWLSGSSNSSENVVYEPVYAQLGGWESPFSEAFDEAMLIGWLDDPWCSQGNMQIQAEVVQPLIKDIKPRWAGVAGSCGKANAIKCHKPTMTGDNFQNPFMVFYGKLWGGLYLGLAHDK